MARLIEILTRKIGGELTGEIPVAVIEQMIILAVASTVMDDGFCANATLCLCGGYWGGVITLLIRLRGKAPSRFDRLFVQHGTLLLILGAIALLAFGNLLHFLAMLCAKL